jgi:hypothetical protein
MKKVLKVGVLVVLASGAAFGQAAGGATVDIAAAGTAAVASSTLYVGAAGAAALALWGLKAPIRIGVNFLKTMFK